MRISRLWLALALLIIAGGGASACFSDHDDQSERPTQSLTLARFDPCSALSEEDKVRLSLRSPSSPSATFSGDGCEYEDTAVGVDMLIMRSQGTSGAAFVQRFTKSKK